MNRIAFEANVVDFSERLLKPFVGDLLVDVVGQMVGVSEALAGTDNSHVEINRRRLLEQSMDNLETAPGSSDIAVRGLYNA